MGSGHAAWRRVLALRGHQLLHGTDPVGGGSRSGRRAHRRATLDRALPDPRQPAASIHRRSLMTDETTTRPLIERWFPVASVDSACGTPEGSGQNEKAIFTWFA